MNNTKRLTLLCGHYGSGKTNVAVNMALSLKATHDKVAIADLDIVNPYFRAKDSTKDFENVGIRLICSKYANSNVDIPALPPDMYTLVDDKEMYAVLDIGGDDRGAYVLGRIKNQILNENNYSMLMVINCYRPLTPDAQSVMEVMNEIVTACGIEFTGLVNNSNLGENTSKEDILNSLEFARQVEKLSGLPVVMTSVKEDLYDEVKDLVPHPYPLKLQAKII